MPRGKKKGREGRRGKKLLFLDPFFLLVRAEGVESGAVVLMDRLLFVVAFHGGRMEGRKEGRRERERETAIEQQRSAKKFFLPQFSKLRKNFFIQGKSKKKRQAI